MIRGDSTFSTSDDAAYTPPTLARETREGSVSRATDTARIAVTAAPT